MPAAKLLPYTVILKAAPPAVAVLGWTEAMYGVVTGDVPVTENALFR